MVDQLAQKRQKRKAEWLLTLTSLVSPSAAQVQSTTALYAARFRGPLLSALLWLFVYRALFRRARAGITATTAVHLPRRLFCTLSEVSTPRTWHTCCFASDCTIPFANRNICRRIFQVSNRRKKSFDVIAKQTDCTIAKEAQPSSKSSILVTMVSAGRRAVYFQFTPTAAALTVLNGEHSRRIVRR